MVSYQSAFKNSTRKRVPVPKRGSMNEGDLVSIIITTYNRRAYLKAAVESVLTQDYADKEVIVVDDGSTDGSAEEVRGLPVHYAWKENQGISSARNYGISLAQGEFIAFLDVDDLWKKGKLSLQTRLMEEQGRLISYTDEIWIRNGKRLNQGLRHHKYSGMIYEYCLPLCIISPSSVVISRSVFEDVGLFDETMPVCEDYDMWLRITCRYPVLFVDKPLIVKHGGHPDQLSRLYEGMDTFRIKSLAKVFSLGILTAEQRRLTLEELKKKCAIYAQGARKRGRLQEAEEYAALVDRLASPELLP
jgi:glycosyltransferase involved in cell wall biosynthesis